MRPVRRRAHLPGRNSFVEVAVCVRRYPANTRFDTTTGPRFGHPLDPMALRWSVRRQIQTSCEPVGFHHAHKAVGCEIHPGVAFAAMYRRGSGI